MKHNLQITIILISMFIVTQLIGLWVINAYEKSDLKLPYNMDPPVPEKQSLSSGLTSMLIAFSFAIFLFFLLTKIKAEKFIRLWFFVVTILAIAITLYVVIFKIFNINSSLIALIISAPLAYFKIFKRKLLVHNITELLIYPGIGIIFVLFLINLMGAKTILGIIILLLAISLYDIWAVWHSEFMQKMAKYQIEKLKFFTGFFVPYAGKKARQKIKLLKQKYKNKSEKAKERAFKKSKIKINLAILGGGDIIFPIITAGIFYKIMGILPALIITASATIGLFVLFMMARKGKFYPAMPFLAIAMYLGMIVTWLVF